MDIIRLCAWGYAALLGFVILTGYIPAFIDANDMIFGLFRRTWYADGLHLVSALWAAAAAITSRTFTPMCFSEEASSRVGSSARRVTTEKSSTWAGTIKNNR